MYCSQCGKQADGEFCWNCGAKLYVPQSNSIETSGSTNVTSGEPVKTVEPVKSTEPKERRLASYSLFRATQPAIAIAGGTFEVDDTHQMMRVTPTYGTEGVYFHFQDIIDAELVRNESSVFKTSTGSMLTRAALGSLISGGLGIVAGSTATKKQQGFITSLYIRVYLKNNSNPFVRIDFVSGKLSNESWLANSAMANIETALGYIKKAQITEPIDTAYDSENSLANIARRIPEAASKSTWRCPSCDYVNSGLTCKNCGKSRPSETENVSRKSAPHIDELPASDNFGKEDWYCPGCDYKNKCTNKTCTSCGMVRPVPGQKQEKEKSLLGLFGKK